MSAQYQKFLKVLEKWPVDKSKVGRDFGEKIRKYTKTLTNPVLLTKEEADKIGKQTDSLDRLANNTYGNKYQRLFDSTATGLSALQCNQVLSSEFLQYLNEDKKK